jgi:hypothetical protein
MSKNKMLIDLPLSGEDEKTLTLYNKALDICELQGKADFDFSKLNHRILLRSKKPRFKIYNDVANNKLVRM